MRAFLIAAVAVLAVGTASLFADQLPIGTWKLKSERVLEGAAPSLPAGTVMIVEYVDGSKGKVMGRINKSLQGVRFDVPVLTRGTLSDDGRTWTQMHTGTEIKSGKPYRSVVVWEKQ